MTTLAGKAALITGAASGIGRAAAQLFAASGCRVALLDRDAAGIAATMDALQPAQRDGAKAIAADSAQGNDLERAVGEALAHCGRIDIALHCAGIYPTFPSLLETPESEWDRIMQVNLRSTFVLSKCVLPPMIAAGGGTLLTVSSVAGLRGTSYSVPYSVAKAGVIQLTKSVAVQYAHKGIRANCIVPGLVDSPMSRKVTGSEAEFERYVNQIPAGRAGTTDDIARLALFLASPESDYINGAALVIDGGVMAK